MKHFFLFIYFVWIVTGYTSAQPKDITVHVDGGWYVKIQPCTPQIVRIRVSNANDFKESLMERYGIIKTDWPYLDITSKVEGNTQIIQTKGYKILIDKKTGNLSVLKAGDKLVIKSIKAYPDGDNVICSNLQKGLQHYFGNIKFGGGIIGDSAYSGKQKERQEITETKKSGVLELSLNPDERFYGAGSATRKQVQHRGSALCIWAAYQKAEFPVPFVMSTDGWGLLNNTTEKNYFDIGNFDKNKFFVYNTSKDIDFYLMLGNSMPDVLDLYTTITGKPYLLPKWAYGLAFGSNMLENQFNVLDNANRFRQEKIPCDIYWLEPQWMAKNYDLSTKKDWNENRFQASYIWLPDPNDEKRTNLFVNRMKDLGFKTALWLCADHDLTIEEEDKLALQSGKPLSGLEHWFPHLNKFIDQGVVGFKLDPGRTLDEHPEMKYYNGTTDAKMHNLNQVLLQKQMYETFREHTGLRSFHHYCGGYAGSQHWGAATVGDNGGNEKSLYDIINHGFSGNSNMSVDALEDMKVKVPGIHYAFFTPWVQINSWAWMLHPWYYNEHDKEMFRYYDQLRYSLIPYIYSSAINSSLTGQPIVWPMALAFPNEPKFANTIHQYMFGNNLLVGAFTDSVYLPEGHWIDYWTGKKYSGKQSLKCNVPHDRGGPLFIKAGAIIPYQKKMQYTGEHPLDTLIIKVYPEKQSSYTLLEDDGVSFDFEKGNISKTRFECVVTDKETKFTIYPCEGTYTGILVSRTYQLEIDSQHKPTKVLINGNKIYSWKYANSGKVILCVSQKNISEKQIVTIY